MLLISCLTGSVCGSNGDLDPYFYDCVKDCYRKRDELESTFIRRFLSWDDMSECQYKCMRKISDNRAQLGRTTFKYFGHWPYYRIYGLQEPASCVFSFLNAVPHIYNLVANRHLFTSEKYYMSGWLVAYGVIAIVAWLCSTAFHARKIGITIDMDYISALVFLAFGLWISVRRTLAGILNSRPLLVSAFFVVWLSLLCFQVGHMLLGNVHFGDHMKVSIAIAAVQCTIWVVWCLFRPNPHWKVCLAIQVWFAIASMLEVFDFPPMFSHFDAHSLWHAATVPLGMLWYYYWILDAAHYHNLVAMNDCKGEVRTVAADKKSS